MARLPSLRGLALALTLWLAGKLAGPRFDVRVMPRLRSKASRQERRALGRLYAKAFSRGIPG